jgi:hypothetical protein
MHVVTFKEVPHNNNIYTNDNSKDTFISHTYPLQHKGVW